ncbi:MAG: type 4a pilus biogenesis protein PilO [Acidimicrobiales bacterium]
MKRPRVLGAVGGALLLIVVFYFAWWSPQGGKLASIEAQKQAQSIQISSLQANLTQLQQDSQFVTRYQSFLTFFGSQVPVQPQQGQLISMLGRLSTSDKVDITQVTANTLVPAVAPSTLSTIPISMTVTGPHDNLLRFLSDMYSLPRLITIQSVAPTSTSTGAGANVLAHNSVPFSLTLTGTAYFTGTVTPAA